LAGEGLAWHQSESLLGRGVYYGGSGVVIKKIGIDELAVGMQVCGIKKTHGEASFYLNNVLIRSESDIKGLHSSLCDFVYVETGPGYGTYGQRPELKQAPGAAGDEEAGLPEAVVEGEVETSPMGAESLRVAVEHDALDLESSGEDPVEFGEEIEKARLIKQEATAAIGSLLNDARVGKSIDGDKVHEVVGGIMDSVFRNRDAITSLTRLNSHDHYTFTHSVNVCILTVALGRWLQMSPEDIRGLGIGAVLHDVGKMLLPEALLNKEGVYTDEEFRTMQRHTLLGADFLSGAAQVGKNSMRVIVEHHERYDGSGYPFKRAGDDIHRFARIASIADIYDAMTTDRVYRSRIVPCEVLKLLYLKRDSYFGPGLVEKFIHCIGIYPIGSLVELNTGEVGLILSVDREHLLQPVVMVVLDGDKRRYRAPFIVDLNEDLSRVITGAADPDRYMLHFDEFLTDEFLT